ncbi:hypothetical protein [Streptomyces sp. NPDC006307]|uniref:hypothetical protein n=1 Tax=Streptomyces sp. NPDC006307 TaxID=3156748 RepID=UPI0033A16B04
MAGTREAGEAEGGAVGGAAEDDALYVLTAALLTPAQFPSVLGDDYPEACAALGLEPYADGYGLVLGQDGDGARWTVAVDDVSLVAVAIASWDCGMEYDLSPDERSVVMALPGWPLELAVAAPGLPAPHDPVPGPGELGPLRPPDAGAWGPALRRLGADEVALHWASWRSRLGDGDFAPPEAAADAPGTSGALGVAGREAPPGASDGGEEASGRGRAELRRVLDELGGYLEDPPPLGRVRSGFAPDGARLLRADGPGWSLVARTDDIAFVLLDALPREVLPVGRGPRLPGLLAALDAMAVRPA